jgi:hypothetical protein
MNSLLDLPSTTLATLEEDILIDSASCKLDLELVLFVLFFADRKLQAANVITRLRIRGAYRIEILIPIRLAINSRACFVGNSGSNRGSK